MRYFWLDFRINGCAADSCRVADRHKLYTEWHERFGPFVRIRIAHRSMLLVADPSAANSVLTKGPNYVPRKPSEYTAFDVVSMLIKGLVKLQCPFESVQQE